MPTKRDPCGSLAGERRHRKKGEPVCEPCAAARAAYQQRWRASNPEQYRLTQQRRKAKREAYRRLAAEHEHEFEQYRREAFARIVAEERTSPDAPLDT